MKLAHALFAIALLTAAPAFAEPGDPVTVQDVARADGGFDVWLDNTLPGPATVDFELTSLNNAAAEVYQQHVVVPAKQRLLIARIYSRDRRAAFNYRHHFWYQFGNRNARPDGTVYRLPYAGSRARLIMQGYNGRFSHQDLNAVDIELPEGTRLLAARGGVVFRSEGRYTTGGPSPDMKGKANYLMILHDDGTIGCYFHLAHQGALVSVGRRVEAGEPIALSGNTGYSTAPHLHFEVRVPNSGKAFRTIATSFRTVSEDEGEVLQEGRSYVAP